MASLPENLSKAMSNSFYLSSDYHPEENEEVETLDILENPPKSQLHSYLKNCFEALLKKKHLIVSPEVARIILTKDLEMNLQNYDSTFCNVLVDCLAYLILTWPGWKIGMKGVQGKMKQTVFYGKFKQYLILHMNNVVTNEGEYRSRIAKNNTVDKADKGTSTDDDSTFEDKRKSLFALEIQGPLDPISIRFIQNNHDIILPKCEFPKHQAGLSFQQLLNFPHFSVSLKLPNVSFTRSIEPEYKRYLSCSEAAEMDPDEDPVSYAMPHPDNALGADTVHSVFTCEFVETYLFQLVQTAVTLFGPHNRRVCDLYMACGQFIKDIKEVNLYDCTASTGVAVSFNIGGSRYLRKTDVAQTTEERQTSSQSGEHRNRVRFHQVIRPMSVFTLHEFEAEQSLELQDSVRFKDLTLTPVPTTSSADAADAATDADKEDQNGRPRRRSQWELPSGLRGLQAALRYACTACRVAFEGADAREEAGRHFARRHLLHFDVECAACGRRFGARTLAEKRWRHECAGRGEEAGREEEAVTGGTGGESTERKSGEK